MKRFCAFFSLTMVLISTVTFIVSTIDELQTDEHGMVEFPLLLQIIGVIDHFSIGFFTIEYLMRVTCSPRKLKFIGAPMNMIDLFAIIPFYLSLLLEGLEDFEIIGKAGKIIRLVKVKTKAYTIESTQPSNTSNHVLEGDADPENLQAGPPLCRAPVSLLHSAAGASNCTIVKNPQKWI